MFDFFSFYWFDIIHLIILNIITSILIYIFIRVKKKTKIHNQIVLFINV